MKISIKKNGEGAVFDTKILDDSGKPLAYVKELTIRISTDKACPEVHMVLTPPKLCLDIEDVEAEVTTEEPEIPTQKLMQGEYLHGPHSSLAPGKLAACCYTCEREDECRPMGIASRFVCSQCGRDCITDALTGDEIEVTAMKTECCLTPSMDAQCAQCRHDLRGEESAEDQE